MRKERAVVVFSGGQDSTTCLAKAIHDYGKEQVACITFFYGQRHGLEVEVAKRIAADFGIRDHKILQMDWYNQITTNALLDPTLSIEKTSGASCPNTVVDGRNMLFLTLAAVYAKSIGAQDVITGVCETDFSGYPDCRDVFVKSCNVTLNLAMETNFRIITPLMDLTKEETWALADSLGVLEYIAEKTLTCYNGIIGKGCGICPSCKLRQHGYDAYMAHRANKKDD